MNDTRSKKEPFNPEESFDSLSFKNKLLLLNVFEHHTFRSTSGYLFPIQVLFMILTCPILRRMPVFLILVIILIFIHQFYFQRKLVDYATRFKEKNGLLVLNFKNSYAYLHEVKLTYFILYYIIMAPIIAFFLWLLI